MLQPFTKLLISSLTFLLVSSNCQSQIKMAYNIGSIGTSGSVSPQFSGTIIIDTAACFSLSNGVKTMQLAGKGIFTNGCQLLLNNMAEIKLSAFPNPVVNSVFIKTADNSRLPTNNIITIELIDLQGRLLKTFSTNMVALNAGYEIRMNGIVGGIYTIKILAGNSKIGIIKIVKS